MVAWKSAFCRISDIIDIKVLSFSFIDDDKSAVCLTRRAENGICNKEFDS